MINIYKILIFFLIFILNYYNSDSQGMCRKKLFHNNDCNNRIIKYYDVNLPPYEKWPHNTTHQAQIVYYNNDLIETLNFASERYYESFDVNYTSALINWCMAYWAAQCDPACGEEIIWMATDNGARFYWTINPEVPDHPYAHGYTATAVDYNAMDDIVAASNCGTEVIPSHGMSEIWLNNSDEYYLQSSEFYNFWTTDPAYVFKYLGTQPERRGILFQYILLHEMGHYLGLPHDMSGLMIEGYWLVGNYTNNPTILQCDADRFRRLYCQGCMGRIPVRIDPPTDVFENIDYENIINIIPNPTELPYFTIQYKLEKLIKVRISLYDLSGKFIRLLSNEIKDKGDYFFSYPTFDLPSGLFLLLIEMDNKIVTKPLLIKN
ncbi:MAG: T9SS type A sorting domain-containing protein [Bacteroidetes bacterium]|nr:MAG: T9SS type A sorting domain-containing protein [Bacteroidota bacterium]